MRRREFITLLGGAVSSLPFAARAQQPERMRRIGLLAGVAANDAEGQVRDAAFRQGLQQLGWTVGRNLQIEYRWAAGSASDAHKYASELVALAPEAIFVAGGAMLGPMLQATRTVPIVFAIVPDPVGSGFVASLARPGGNATGFMQFEYNLSAKWPELLKEIAPDITRAAVLWDPGIPHGIGQFAIIQSVAPALGIDMTPINARDAAGIERGVAEFARLPNGGLIVTGSALTVVHRDLIVMLAARHKLPAVYFQRQFADGGGLVSYGTNWVDQFRRAASYVDRVLKGEKPADLPVQAPTRYELIVNLKTAKAHGFVMPAALLARADEIIE